MTLRGVLSVNKEMETKVWSLVIALALCLVATYVRAEEEEALWLQEDFEIEGLRELRDTIGLPHWYPQDGIALLNRLNPRHPKRFQYDEPSEGTCEDTTSTDVSTCFSYFKDSADNKWYQQNCCACDVDSKFNIVDPAKAQDQQPNFIFFNQGPLPIGARQRLFFLDDNPHLLPQLFSAELDNVLLS